MATMNMCAMDIIAFEKLLVDRNIRTNIELAERCGIDRNTAGKIRKGEELPYIRTNIELAERCGIDRNTAGKIRKGEELPCSALPENTSLQKNVKNHLLSGGVIRNAYGRLR